MSKSGNTQHFFTVRGQGFDSKQWRALTEIVAQVVKKSQEEGISVEVEADASHLVVTGPKGEGTPLVIWKKGEPGIPKLILSQGPYDLVVQSVLTAVKKVAPDLFEMTSPDGRDYRRVLAKQTEAFKEKLRSIAKDSREAKNRSFRQSVKRQKWPHPVTNNLVEFVSLPKTEQTRIRHRWDAEYGRRFDMAAQRAMSKLREAEKARTEALRQKEQAEDAVKDVKNSPATPPPKKAAHMNDEMIYKAAIRVAATTKDKALKKALLEILRPTLSRASSHCENHLCDCKHKDEKTGRHEEDKEIDVGDYLKSKGMHEDAEKWEKHEGEVAKKATSRRATQAVFPSVYELACRSVVAFAKGTPKSALKSNALRIKLADRLAKEWIQDAIKRPGRVRKYLGVPEGEEIPMGKLDEAIEKVKDSGNKSLLAALLLAKRLKSDLGK